MKELTLKFSTFVLYLIGSAFSSTLQHFKLLLAPALPPAGNGGHAIIDRSGCFLQAQKPGKAMGAFYSPSPVLLQL